MRARLGFAVVVMLTAAFTVNAAVAEVAVAPPQPLTTQSKVAPESPVPTPVSVKLAAPHKNRRQLVPHLVVAGTELDDLDQIRSRLVPSFFKSLLNTTVMIEQDQCRTGPLGLRIGPQPTMRLFIVKNP